MAFFVGVATAVVSFLTNKIRYCLSFCYLLLDCSKVYFNLRGIK